MADVIVPDEKDHGDSFAVKKVFEKIDEIHDKTEDEQYEELLSALSEGNAWIKALKPMIESRIEAYKAMSEVKFDGNETIKEIGLKYITSSLVVKELENIISTVEQSKDE